MKIAVTGATGFIGSYLIDELLNHTNHEIVAISRSPMTSEHPRLACRQGDLYSLLDCENLLQDCDAAIYLVHSMSPSERLSQGHFKDFDFILADNFAKAAQKNGVKKIIYVSGLIPSSTHLSDHLESRLEVEKTLQAHGVPTLTLRCGIVLGKGGSSFQMVEALVKRLPVIVLPAWTESPTQAIYIKDLVQVIKKLIAKDFHTSESFDLGSPERVRYQDLLKKVAKHLKTKNVFIHFRSIPRSLSKLWVQLITGQSGALVYPLVDSLIHPMLVDPLRTLPNELAPEFHGLDEAIENSLSKDQTPKLPLRREKTGKAEASLVRSVQRLPKPKHWTMDDIAKYYIHWLPRFLKPFISTQVEGNTVSFGLLFFKKPMLILELSEKRTFKGRQLFYIKGGLLDGGGPKGRLEFRHSPEQNFFIAAIHNFRPSLPWYIYRYTQALLHAMVMQFFGRRLKKLESTQPFDEKATRENER